MVEQRVTVGSKRVFLPSQGRGYKGLRDCNFLSLEFLPVHLGNRYLDRYQHSAGAILGMEENRRLFYYFYSTRRKKESVERSRENSTEGRSSHFSQDSNSSSNSSSPRSHRYCISRFLDCLRLYRDRDNYGLSGWIRFCLGRARRCVIMERLQISRPLRDQLYTGCWSGS